ncbi:TIGR03915 family putative DNA repair protein [Aquimarina pacifica]|uniref:TIGR03915 family putative DNA repair protein n=1 Tax=Aquimarina pacifica TaxID=1296415 RepID=UPI000471B838|nr:TIGR03915 family putative DNA repair protein [Aquimarina pacifica]
MHSQTIILYDGSFDGFLCAVFLIYEQKVTHPIINKKNKSTPTQLFATTEEIHTEKQKAKRVWDGFKLKTTKTQQRMFFKAFLSEIKGVENTLFNYLRIVFMKEKTDTSIDYSNKDILKISQVAKMVQREKHRIEAFVRFRLTTDNIYTSIIEPDFNVLPLITSHFKDRYADQKWMIYDLKRSYGIYYDLKKIEIITIEGTVKSNIDIKSLSSNEKEFEALWRTYFSNVNIISRKNNKLHLRHLPKRYWKYLIEKN